MKFPQYYVNQDGVVHTIFDRNSSTCGNLFQLVEVTEEDTSTVLILERDGVDLGLLIVDEFTLWPTLMSLAEAIEGE